LNLYLDLHLSLYTLDDLQIICDRYILFLPKYCSEMNPIELEWQHIKKDELAGQMFEDELELAYAVINGVEARGKKGNYSTKRIKLRAELVT
ncbi:transposase, partial [Microcoleus sp. Pol17_C1]|uniref:transposase n=1 Tax=unclassified Microcoleus TaxID=2642155 RepID=UPI002FD241C5